MARPKTGEAIGPQTDALDQLRQGTRDFAKQLREKMSQGWAIRRR
jgi:hypothetical protein